MKLLFSSFISLLFCLCFLSLEAQLTGSFKQQQQFNEPDYTAQRTLYYHVPSNYSAFKSYPLIFGFRGGPHANAGAFRDELIPLSDSLDAIIFCPENIAHFGNDEVGVRKLYDYALDTLMTQYNIDTNRIYVTGLSFGGRHAVIISMDDDAGPLHPQRGVIPFAAGRNSQDYPDYNKIDSFPPACMCLGLNDQQVFKDVTQTIHEAIEANGGKSILNEVPNVGHSTAFASFPDEMMECIRYIESQYPTTDIEESISDKTNIIINNPVEDILMINKALSDDLLRVNIFNLDGRLLYTQNENLSRIECDHLTTGSYLLRVVKKNNEVLATHFVKI